MLLQLVAYTNGLKSQILPHSHPKMVRFSVYVPQITRFLLRRVKCEQASHSTVHHKQTSMFVLDNSMYDSHSNEINHLGYPDKIVHHLLLHLQWYPHGDCMDTSLSAHASHNSHTVQYLLGKLQCTVISD